MLSICRGIILQLISIDIFAKYSLNILKIKIISHQYIKFDPIIFLSEKINVNQKNCSLLRMVLLIKIKLQLIIKPDNSQLLNFLIMLSQQLKMAETKTQQEIKITNTTRNLKDKLKQGLINKQRQVEELQNLMPCNNIFTLQQFNRFQLPQGAFLVDVLWKFQLLDQKREEWKIKMKLSTLRKIGVQSKINPPYDRNEGLRIISNFNKNFLKKNQKCKAILESDRTISLQCINIYYEYNKNKKIEKIISVMNQLQRNFELIFKQIIQFTSISDCYPKKIRSQIIQNSKSLINNSSQLPSALSYVTPNIPIQTQQTNKQTTIPKKTNHKSEKNGIVRFFSQTETIGQEKYINGYSEDCQSLSVLLFGNYRLYIEVSLYYQPNLNGLLKDKPLQLKLIKKKVQKKIEQISFNAFSSQTNILRELRNDGSCQYIARYYMKTIKQYQQEHSDFFFVEIYDSTLEHLIKQNKLTLQEYMKIFADIVSGIKYLNQDRKILHRDIKASNICIVCQKTRFIPKIIDFGSSIYLGNREHLSTVSNDYFTPGYYLPYNLCPEPIKKKYQTQKSYNKNKSFDIYSFGAMLQWFLKCYMKKNISQQIEAWSKCGQIIQKCKRPDPDQRPGLDQLINKFNLLSLK